MTESPTASARARLRTDGPHSLTDGELLTVLLRTGVAGEPVGHLANRLLEDAGGLAELLRGFLFLFSVTYNRPEEEDR